MKCYTYDEKTKEYKGESTAQIDPLETEMAGKDIWILPANATFVESPKVKDHEVAVWNDKEWEIKEDWRKTELYNPETEDRKTLSEIGPKPEGYYPIKQQAKTAYFNIEVREDGVYFVDREKTYEEKYTEISSQREAEYNKIDKLHARKSRKVVLQEWTEEDEAEYQEQVKALQAEIEKNYPYPEK